MGHSPVFSPLRLGSLNYGAFYSMAGNLGCENYIYNQRVINGALEGVKLYVSDGAFSEFTDEEVSELVKFVREGGSLFLLLHVAAPYKRLLEGFGIETTESFVAEPEYNIGDVKDFVIPEIKKHPITDKIRLLTVYGVFGFKGDEESLVAKSSADSFIDKNKNLKFDEGEERGPFGLIVAKEFGQGRVVAIGDDAVLGDKYIMEAENRKLLPNIILWLLRKTP